MTAASMVAHLVSQWAELMADLRADRLALNSAEKMVAHWVDSMDERSAVTTAAWMVDVMVVMWEGRWAVRRVGQSAVLMDTNLAA